MILKLSFYTLGGAKAQTGSGLSISRNVGYFCVAKASQLDLVILNFNLSSEYYIR